MSHHEDACSTFEPGDLRLGDPGIDDIDRALLKLADRAPGQTSRSVAHTLELSHAQAQLALRRLADAGLLDRSPAHAGEAAHAISPAGRAHLEQLSLQHAGAG